MLKKVFKSFVYLIALAVVSTAGAVLIREAIAAWTGPTANPPGGNVDTLLNTGAVAQTKTGDLTVNKLIANSSAGIGIDSPNRQLHIKTASGNAEFDIQSAAQGYWALYQDATSGELRFWNTNVTSTSTKNALVLTKEGYLKVPTPINSGDVATKGYVDAAAGGGDATAANQQAIMGSGFSSSTDSLKSLSTKINAIPTSGGDATYSKQLEIQSDVQRTFGWIVPSSTYVSVGGNTAFCRSNVVSAGGITTVTNINNGLTCDTNRQCSNGACASIQSLTFFGATHSEAQCTGAGGAVYNTGNGTICKITGSSCPSGWSQADNWQHYTAIGWGSLTQGDSCGFFKDSGPLNFTNQIANDYWHDLGGHNQCGFSDYCDPATMNWGWLVDPMWYSGGSYCGRFAGAESPGMGSNINPSTNRSEIGCK
ncbi:MAG: hypothetical protein AAB956_00260 [Patescibacteria group bacterium]